MSNDPINRLPTAFGRLLSRRLRVERRVTYEALARALELPDPIAIVELECGKGEPTLTQLFRLAAALGDPPAILFIDILTEWQTDLSDHGLYKARASDFERLFRLGYYLDPSDFRELPRVYGSTDAAVGAARKLNAARRSKHQPLLDTVLIYVRLGSRGLRLDRQGEVAP